jgi:hypothetical protein
VRSVKSECLSKLVIFGEASLRRAITEFLKHYHYERNQQWKPICCSSPLLATIERAIEQPLNAESG